MNKPGIVVLTGAGMSAESGLKTFRAEDGLWEEHRVEDVATPEGYRRDSALVHRFYSERRAQCRQAEPNAAHRALADFATAFQGSFTLITQNIDDLHERAGSPSVLHMHGELLKMRCEATGKVVDWLEATSGETRCSCCTSPTALRPHVVWFGEMPLFLDEIAGSLADCELFVSIGTSGNVYPAAGFVQTAKAHGARAIELNLEPSAGATFFDEGHYGPATRVVPEFFHALL